MTAKRGMFAAMEEALMMGPEKLFAKVDKDLRNYRQELLIELANNTSTNSVRIQRLMSMCEPELQSMVASAQRDLRSIWPQSVSLPDKQKVVDAWLHGVKRQGRAGIHAWLGRGCLEFDFQSFPGQFVMAILENWWRFQVCANPDCMARYFLTKRSTQVICERGECTRYAQREHAKKYWHKKGKFRKEAKE